MSIFKDTFKPYIKNQLNARQDLVDFSHEKRPALFNQYTSGKAAWSRMVSLVDYNSPDGKYKGQELSRKYVLQGGTLYNSTNNNSIEDYSLRSGLATKNSAYGSKSITSKMYGYRPMPGISNISVESKTAYGSLREAVITFFCWDKKQLDELDVLFMRPGYGVLLEWGWSMYLPTNDYKNISSISDKNLKYFDGLTINPFQDDLNQDFLYERLEYYREKYSGNYDGMFGFIKNFNWELLPNGGFQCTTTLISAGEVIESIKLNSAIVDKSTTEEKENKDQETITNFEKFLNNVAIGKYTDPSIDTNNSIKQDIITLSTANVNEQYNYIQFGYFIYLINKNINILDNTGAELYEIEVPLEGYNNIGNGLCLASEDSVTIDLRICLIKNSKAKFIADKDYGFDISKLDNYYYKGNIVGDLTPKKMTFDIDEYLSDSFGNIGKIYLNISFIKSVYLEMLKNTSNNGVVSLITFLKKILEGMSNSLGDINNFDIYTTDNKIVIIDKNYCEEGTSSNSKFKLNIIGTNSIVRKASIASKIFPSQSNLIAIAAGVGNSLSSVHDVTTVKLNEGMKNRIIRRETEPSEDIKKAAKEANKSIDEYLKDIKEDDLYNKELAIKQQYADKVRILQNYLKDGILKMNDNDISTCRSILNDVLTRINIDTNFKAIIPITLEVTIDGIGGIVMGEIFTIDDTILPTNYINANVGFITSGLKQELIRNDWTTNIRGYVCLLDQDKLLSKGLLDRNVSLKNSIINIIASKVAEENNNKNLSIFYFNLMMGIFYDLYSNNLFFKYSSKKNFPNIGSLDDEFKTYKGKNRMILKSVEVANSFNTPFENITENEIFQEIDNSLKLSINNKLDKGEIFTPDDSKIYNYKKLALQINYYRSSEQNVIIKIFNNISYYNKIDNNLKKVFDSFLNKFLESGETVILYRPIYKNYTSVINDINMPLENVIPFLLINK